jgi:hypothetical protein
VLSTCLHAGCFNPVEASNAYDDEVDLCALEQAPEYARRVAECRARWQQDPRSCAGVVSFTGLVQGVNVVVDAELSGTEVRDFQVGQGTQRDRVKLLGASPYFLFELTMKLLGTPLDATSARTLNINPARDPESSWYADDRGEVELSLLAGASGEVQLTRGQLVIEQQTANENSGHFEGSNDKDSLRGCYHAFTTDMTLQLGEP